MCTIISFELLDELIKRNTRNKIYDLGEYKSTFIHNNAIFLTAKLLIQIVFSKNADN